MVATQSNQFHVDLDVSINCGKKIRDWINLRHEQSLTTEHYESLKKVMMDRKVRLVIEVNEHGNWQLVEAKLI